MVAPTPDLGAMYSTILEAVGSGLIVIDRYPVEILPGYWVISGAIPYEGEVALAAVDFDSSAFLRALEQRPSSTGLRAGEALLKR